MRLRPNEIQVSALIIREFTKKFPTAQYIEAGNIIQIFVTLDKYEAALAEEAKRIKLGDNYAQVE